jgi:hypothetical protein
LKSKEQRDKEDAAKKKAEGKEENLDINPFSALLGIFDLFGFGKKKDEKKAKKEFVPAEKIKKDNFVEKTMRGNAMAEAAKGLYLIYDVYKKAHRMASAPNVGFDTHDTDKSESLQDGGSVGWKEVFEGRGD